MGIPIQDTEKSCPKPFKNEDCRHCRSRPRGLRLCALVDGDSDPPVHLDQRSADPGRALRRHAVAYQEQDDMDVRLSMVANPTARSPTAEEFNDPANILIDNFVDNTNDPPTTTITIPAGYEQGNSSCSGSGIT